MSGLTGRKTFPAPLDSDAVAGRRREILAAADEPVERGPFAPTWESLSGYRVPDWYTDAKFGIFIHWLVAQYRPTAMSGTRGRCTSMAPPNSSHHRADLRRARAPVSKTSCRISPPITSTPPTGWRLIRRTGARYVVPVAEHHDGYHLGHTDVSRWSATPHRTQPGPARRAQGGRRTPKAMDFGLSSHRAEHWWFFNGGTGFDSDVRDPAMGGPLWPGRTEEAPSPTEEFLDDWLARTIELVERYRPELGVVRLVDRGTSIRAIPAQVRRLLL